MIMAAKARASGGTNLGAWFDRDISRPDPYPPYPTSGYVANHDPVFNKIKNELVLRAIDELHREQTMEMELKRKGYGKSKEPTSAYNEIAGRSNADIYKMNPKAPLPYEQY
jgi:hypothetical protein